MPSQNEGCEGSLQLVGSTASPPKPDGNLSLQAATLPLGNTMTNNPAVLLGVLGETGASDLLESGTPIGTPEHKWQVVRRRATGMQSALDKRTLKS